MRLGFTATTNHCARMVATARPPQFSLHCCQPALVPRTTRLPHICPLVATRRSSAAAGCGSRSGRRCSRRWVARTVNAQRQAVTHRIKLPWHPLISRSAQPTCSAQPGGQHPQAVQRRCQRAQQAGQHNGDLPRLHNVEAPSDAEPVPRALHPPAPQGWGRQEACGVRLESHPANMPALRSRTGQAMEASDSAVRHLRLQSTAALPLSGTCPTA